MNAIITHPRQWADAVVAEVVAEIESTTINPEAALIVIDSELTATRSARRAARSAYERALHDAVAEGLERLAAPIRPLAA